jgi:alpha-mannosidase
MVAAYNRQENAPLTLRLAVPSEFEAVVAKRTDRPVYKGELNPIFQGTYSSRIELKRWMRDMEQRLLTAEKLAAITSTLGAPVDRANLWRAWEPVLFNETHDLASGVMTDRVYDDTIRSYEFSSRLADEQIHTGLNHLRFQIDTLGEGMPIVVWNPLAWPRTDTVELQIGFEPQAAGTIPVKGYKVFDPSGNETPAQTIGSQIYAHNGGIRAARIAFLARDVPALGYAVYRVHASETAGPPPGSSVDANSLENEHLKLSIDRATGAITSLVVKNGGWEALAGPGNVVSREPDKGDLWELYRGLDGGSKVAMKNRQPVPREGTASLTTTKPGKPGAIRVGPLFSEFQVENPFDSGTFATRVRLVHASRRVEIETRLVNNEKYVRYQVRFPTPFKPGRTFHEIPFGSVEQPEGIEFPAQNWVDHSDGTRGLAVLNLGIPGCVVTEGTILLSLLRSHNLGAYGFGGGYEPGMSSESGFQIGKERTMRYALLPHVGDARSARIFRDGMEYNHPLLARKAESHAGPLPPTGSFLGVSNPNVVLTSLTPGPEGQVIARLYEAAGTEAQGVSLTTARPIRSAAECNLLDQERKPLELSQGGLKFDLRPFEIKTFALRFDPPAPAE